MDTSIKTRFSSALLFLAAMVLPVGGAMAQGTMMDNGTMGNGHWYGYGGGPWIPVLVVVVVGAVLFAVLRRKQ